MTSVRDAREHLKSGRIIERGRSINNAYLVLAELSASLRSEEAPELGKRLGGLYAYMQGKLLEANLKQQDAPLAEVLALLTTLDEAWAAIPDAVEAEPQPCLTNPWAAPSVMDGEPVRLALTA
jgi:flagellar protein FliS